MNNQSGQTDILTGLPNITYFRFLSQQVLDDPAQRAKGLVFIYFDIKNFRSYNYYYGFDAGDRYLVKVGNIINEIFPELYVSRFADDHFTVIAYDKDIVRRIGIVRKQAIVEQMNKSISIKAGIYVVPADGRKHNSVKAYDNAKLACENIKKNSNILNCYYTEELGRHEKLREHIIETIDEAISKEYIKVYYQPIVHVLSGRLCGYEGLARWIDPKFGFLSPADFISTLENARLIHRLDTYMINKICQDTHKFKNNGWTIVPVSVNLSALDFQMADMPIIADQAIKENELPPDFLNIEITESALSGDRQDVQDVLDRFHQSGFEIWMDNFGSKYSSLNILEDVTVDLLKVDMRFLKTFHTSSRSRIILKNIMNMAKELGIRTLMEGVEDEDVLEFLRQTGCEKAQGYLFGKPALMEGFNHVNLKPEPKNVRKYYNNIGNINLLSQTPLQTGWSEEKNKNGDVSEFNGIPLAIVEFDGKNFHFLMSNHNFRKVFEALGVGGRKTPDGVFNNPMLQFSLKARNAARQCIFEGNEIVRDFVTSAGFHNLRFRCIAYNEETNTGALLAVVEQVSGSDTLKRQERKNIALRFLYSLYSRIDLLKLDGTEIENIYLNSSRYRDTFVKTSVEVSVKNFAKHNIYVEDQQKFINLYNIENIEKNFADGRVEQLTDYFRTINDDGIYTWQMYMQVPIVIKGEKYILSCVREIDMEKMRRLPDIDRMGIEYYDMPSNPIFLLIAARAFTSTFGYGSFEQFLNNSFFLEINLTKNLILHIHIGGDGILDSKYYEGMNYDDFLVEINKRSLLEEDIVEVDRIFNRNSLLEAYKNGITSGQLEFLRHVEGDSKQRWVQSAYQLREYSKTGDIYAFMLTFDIDSYRRMSEHMVMLIERDNLTGLYNRGTVIKMILKHLSTLNDGKAALIILDLDNFKQINDRFGHDCGDMIIKDAALRMKQVFSQRGLVSRIGGDEFLVFLQDLDYTDVDILLSNFSSSIKEIEYHGQRLTYTMSIGYAVYPEHGTDYRILYQNADMALYSVKMSGRANYKLFSTNMLNVNRKQLGFGINQLSEGMPGGFLVYRDNETLEILFANKRLMSIYECDTLEEFRTLTGNSFKGCVHPDDWEHVKETIAKQIDISDGYDYIRYRATTAKGNIRLIEDFGRLVHSPDDGDIFYVFIIDYENKEKIYEDITPSDERN